MKKKINNRLIRTFKPCYDPSNIGISDKESLPIKEWIEKYRTMVKDQSDIVWLVCRKEFMSDKDMRFFAVWCARQSYQYCTDENPIDQRSIDAIDCAERFANGLVTEDELSAAASAAWSAAWSAKSAAASAAKSAAESAAWSAAWYAKSAAESAAWSAAWSAARDARSAQIDQLLTYFK